LRTFTRRLLLIFVAGSAVSVAILHALADGDDLPGVAGPYGWNLLVAISLYNGLSLAGYVVMVRYISSGSTFAQRMPPMLAVFIACAIIRAPLSGDWPELGDLALNVLWRTGRAVGVAFAVAYLAHGIYSRYFPTTILRTRDITPVLVEGKVISSKRRSHARNAQWLFDMRDRKYLDSTRLELRTREGPSFTWADWGEASFWSGLLLVSFSMYAEVYPRVSDAFDVVLTAVMSGQMLALIPLLILPSYPVDRLGAQIPVGDGHFRLSEGFRHTAFRWTKLSFIPIIVIAILVRGDLVEQAWESMAEALLISVPTAAMVNMVYLEWFRDRTVAAIHRAIPEWERKEMKELGSEPWRERSLMEGVEAVESIEAVVDDGHAADA
jgi:hypothetical protein